MIREEGIEGGIFDLGSSDLYIHKVNLISARWFETQEFLQPFNTWYEQLINFGEHQAVFLASKGKSILDSSPPQNQLIGVLFLAANPKNTPELNLTKEVKRIDEELLKAQNRDEFDLHQRHAVSVSELQGLLLRFRPNIVHFSGHGSRESALVLQDEYGKAEVTPPSGLTNLFRIVNTDRKNIQCVVLNACYSERQAEAISKHIPCVIGMSNAISDVAAITFAASFYRALGHGESINTAFELGCNDIEIHNIPEEATPRLKFAPGVDPAKVFLTKSSSRKQGRTLT